MRPLSVIPVMRWIFIVAVVVLRPVVASGAGASVGGDDVLIASFDDVNKVSMDVSADGDVFCAVEHFDSGSGRDRIFVYTSTDGGTSFSLLYLLSSNDHDYQLANLTIAAGNTPRIFLFYHELDWSGATLAQTGRMLWADPANPVAWTEVEVFSLGISMSHGATDAFAFDDYYAYSVGAHAASGSIYFSRSIDQGETWEAPYIIYISPGFPWLPTDPKVSYGFNSVVHVAWTLFDTTDYQTSGIQYRRALNYANNGIAAWEPGPVAITPVSTGVTRLIMDIHGALDGSVVMTQADFSAPAEDFRYSTDSGATWPAANVTELAISRTSGPDLVLRDDGSEFIVGGAGFLNGGVDFEAGYQTASTNAPGTLAAPNCLSTPIDLSPYDFDAATDPSRGSRVCMVWVDYGVNDVYFDAEWFTDPGVPNREFKVELGTPDPGEFANAPAVVDVNVSPELEIVFADATGKLHLMDHLGNEQANWPKNLGAIPENSPAAVGDLTGNGSPYIVQGDANGFVHVYRPDGNIPGGNWPAALSPGDVYVSIGAVEGGSSRSIVATVNQALFVLDAWGAVEQSWVFGSPFQNAAAIGDLDQDMTAEIVTCVGSNVNVLRLDHHPGSVDVRVFPGVTFTHQPSLGDIDLDGDLEIALATDDGTLYVLQHDLTDYPGWPYIPPPIGSALGPITQPALANIVGTSQVEIAVSAVTGVSDLVRLFSHDGGLRSGFPHTVSGGPSGVIFDAVHPGSFSSMVLATTAPEAFTIDNVPTGNPPLGWPRALEASGGATPASGDIDLDGANEFVFVTESGVEVFDVNHPPAPDGFRWPMKGYDAQRTGCFRCPEFPSPPTPVDPVRNATRLSFASPYPNPAGVGSEISFRYVLPSDAHVTLEIFDPRGRRIRTIQDRNAGAGDWSLSFDGRDRRGGDLASGTYFARLRAVGGSLDETLIRRFSLLR